MKLSLKRKFGMVRVRAGQFVRVAKGHMVTNHQEEGHPRYAAQPGDLAVEVVNIKLGELMGYSYLSGRAMRAIDYDLDPSWFEPASSRRIELRTPTSAEDADTFMADLRAAMADAKLNHDAGLIKYKLTKHEGEWLSVVQILHQIYGEVEGDGRGHIFGSVKHNKREGGLFMIQPENMVTEEGVTQFQIALACGEKG